MPTGIPNARERLVDLLDDLVLRIDLAEVLQTDERVGTVVILAPAVIRVLQRVRPERGGLPHGLLAEQDEPLAEIGEVRGRELLRIFAPRARGGTT